MRDGWTTYRFDEVFDLQMGKTPDRKTPEYFGGENIWVSIRDLDDKYLSKSNECISDEAVRITNIKKVTAGTVIMSFKLTVGKCAIAAKDLYTNEAIMAFNLKEGFEIDNSFLYYYLQGYKWNGANKAVMGMTLNKATISKHKISYPSLDIQQTIVFELDKINELISLKKAQLNDLDALAQSLFYDMFGDPIENEKGWPKKKLGEICSQITDGSHNPPKGLDYSEYPMLSSKNIFFGRYNYESPRYLSKEEFEIENRRTDIKEGDILFTIVGTVGRVCFVKGNFKPFTLQRSVAVLKPKKEFVISQFLVYNLHSMAPLWETESKGVAQKGIYLRQLASIPISVPPIALQQSFEAKIEAVELQKKQISSSITDLENMLASRMQYWFD